MSSTITALTSGGGIALAGDTSGQLELKTNNGTTAVTIDTAQNVGIGVTPSAWDAAYKSIDIGAYGNINSRTNQLTVVSNGYYNGSAWIYKNTNPIALYQQAEGTHNWWYAPSGTAGATVSLTRAMTIDSSGNLLVGGTSQTNLAKVESFFNGNSLNGFVANDTDSASSSNFFMCSLNGVNIGTIARVGATSAVVYNTTSDQRLKSNIADANPVLDKLMTVKVRQFNWTEGDLHQDAGFIAQELAPVLSGIVTEGKTEDDMWQLDYSRITPYLVKAIQELNAKVDAQATTIADQEARLAVLEAK